MKSDPIEHPYGSIEAGHALEILPNFFWVRLPLPFRLNHVNIWLLRDKNTWACIDCGLDDPRIHAIWDRLGNDLFENRLDKIITTHGHTDHAGLSGHLVSRFGGEYHATLTEWLTASLEVAEHDKDRSADLTPFYRAHGFDAVMIERVLQDRESVRSRMGAQPASINRMRDGETIHFGGYKWRIIVAGGHAPEHASFYCEDNKILIAGDQILERISPIIGTYPFAGNDDPLSEYLASLERFSCLPAETLVLPSHGVPFRGLQTRIDILRQHHFERLDIVESRLATPATAAEVAVHLFEGPMKENQSFFAFSETLAHINHLAARGRIHREIDSAGKISFQAVAR